MIKYIIALFIFLLIFIFISHNINNKRINTELNIQQTEHPDINMISLLQGKKLPTVYLYELELWEGFDLLIGEEYETIKEVLDNKEAFNKLKYYLQPFNLPLTTKWDISFHKTEEGWNDLPPQPIKELSYNHLIANFSGLMMLCLFNPSPENLEILNFDLRNPEWPNIKEILSNEETTQKLEYIIIPIRPSNMVYIPYGWYYWLYNGIDDKYCCYLDCKNKSLV
jgi:hypothetical protein